MGHTHTMEHYSAIKKKKNQNLAIWEKVDGSWEYHAKWNKLDKDKLKKRKYFTYMWNLKNKANEQTEKDY